MVMASSQVEVKNLFGFFQLCGKLKVGSYVRASVVGMLARDPATTCIAPATATFESHNFQFGRKTCSDL